MSLFDLFIQEKPYLVEISKHTQRSYRIALDKFKGFGLENSALNQFVILLRESGLKKGACNFYIRSVNSRGVLRMSTLLNT